MLRQETWACDPPRGWCRSLGGAIIRPDEGGPGWLRLGMDEVRLFLLLLLYLIIFIVGSVIDWAHYSIYIRRLARNVDDATITASALVVGAALLLPFGAGELTVVTPRLTPAGVIAVVYSGLAASALGYWLWSYGLARVPAAAATTSA